MRKGTLRRIKISDNPEIQRINNQLATEAENQARFDEHMGEMLEAIAEIIKSERSQNSRIEENRRQITSLIEVAQLNTEQIEALTEQGKKQDERINALAEQGKGQSEKINVLIRIVEGHISNHP